MMNTLRRFLKKNKLMLCIEKTKVMVFNNKGKREKERWF